MKSLTAFATQNPRIAQFSIAIMLIIAGSVAYHGGIALLAIEGLRIPILFLPIVIGSMFVINKIYYAAGTLKLHKSTVKKRAFVASLIACWLFCFLAGNRTASTAMQEEQNTPTVSTVAGHVPLLMIEGTDSQKAKNWFKWFTTKKKNAVKKEVDYFMKKRMKAGGAETAGKILLSLLLVALYLIIAALVLSLSCSLSCNGQETAAVLVLIFGLGLSSWGLVAALIAIWRKKSTEYGTDLPGEPGPRRGPSKKEKM